MRLSQLFTKSLQNTNWMFWTSYYKMLLYSCVKCGWKIATHSCCVASWFLISNNSCSLQSADLPRRQLASCWPTIWPISLLFYPSHFHSIRQYILCTIISSDPGAASYLFAWRRRGHMILPTVVILSKRPSTDHSPGYRLINSSLATFTFDAMHQWVRIAITCKLLPHAHIGK